MKMIVGRAVAFVKYIASVLSLIYLPKATEKCSVKQVLFFARSLYCRYWLTCSGRKGYSHWFFFAGHFTRDTWIILVEING